MAGKIAVNTIQLGDSATATQNFVLKTNVDGTATLARGNDGATTQDILTVDANGKVALTNNVVPAFSAYSGTTTAVGAGATQKVTMNTEEFDTSNAYDTTLSRFTPLVAGYYQVNAQIRFTAVVTGEVVPFILKNGSGVKSGQDQAISTLGTVAVNISVLIYLNGATDYLEVAVYSQAASTVAASSVGTFFQAYLVRAA